MVAREPDIPLKNPALAAFLAWLVPGLGHLYQGRTGKGILYMVCILGLFWLGYLIGEGEIVVFWRWVNPLRDMESFRLSYLMQFWTGLSALPALIQATLIHEGYAPILGGFMAEPTIDRYSEIREGLGNLEPVAMLYTSVAGLLNVLAIFDAYGGPAGGREPEAKDTSGAKGGKDGDRTDTPSQPDGAASATTGTDDGGRG